MNTTSLTTLIGTISAILMAVGASGAINNNGLNQAILIFAAGLGGVNSYLTKGK